ncbi:MAG: C25 family cysteine peptidase [Bacteroidota bacterium]
MDIGSICRHIKHLAINERFGANRLVSAAPVRREKWWYGALLCMLFMGGMWTPVAAQGSGYWYMNEWYQFNQNYIKVLVDEDGPCRVSLADLTAAGVANLATLTPQNVQVFYRGEEIPIYVDAAGNNLNYLEFYGHKNDGGMDSLIYRNPYSPFNFDPSQQPNQFTSIFTDTSAYFITWDATAQQRIAGIQPTNYSAYVPEPWYRYRVLSDFASSLVYFEGGGGATEVAHVLNPDFITGEGFLANAEYETGDLIDAMATNVPTPGYANSGNPTRVVARVVSVTTAAEHITAIDVLAQDRYLDTTAGINIKTHAFDMPDPLPATTLVRFHAYGNGSKPDKQRVAWHYLEYDRTFDLNGEVQTVVREFNESDTTYLRFFNADVTAEAWLIDPVNKERTRATVSGDTLHFLVPGASGERTLYVYTDRAVQTPTIKARTSLSNLSDPANGAEYVIITHRRFANSAFRYATYRDTNSIRPLSSRVVYVDQIMDEFAFGSFTSWGIKNFCKYALDNWTVKPKYFLLWGKGRSVHKQSPSVDYVPSFGKPANDYEFVSNFDRDRVNVEPQAAIGRVNLYNDSEGIDYLAKVDEYEHTEYAGWMKKAIFMGGGKTGTEQTRIRGALVDDYKSELEDDPVGAEVFFFQTQGNGIESNTSQTSTEVINGGVGILHFFGHSGTNIFDVDIQEANRYSNFGRYPFMLAFGCYGGNFLETSQSFGERFLLEPGRGCIGYLANSTAGFLQQLSDFGRIFYDIGTDTLYNQPIGDVIRITIRDFANTYNGYSNLLVANHTKQINLQGDPAVVIRFPERPDLAISEPDIFFTPENLSAQETNYNLNVVVHNEGRTFPDSFQLQIRHRAPTGEEITYDPGEYGAFPTIDTLVFPIENTLGNRLAGLNQYEIFVDALDSLEEYSELNNQVNFSPLIQGNIPAILFPYEYAIVDRANLTLSASTYIMSVDASVNYIFEIDTVHTFTSPFKRTSAVINGTANLAKWELPFALTPGTVYYWRVRLADIFPLLWNEASFRYVPGKTGWSQSKPPQFSKDPTEQIELDPVNFEWEFARWSQQLHAYIETQVGSSGKAVYFFGPHGSNGETGSGICYTPISYKTLNPGIRDVPLYGDWRFLPAPTANDPSVVDDLVSSISNTVEGDYFLLVSALDPRLGFWRDAQKQALGQIGVRYEEIKDLPNGQRFVILGRKGYPPGSATVILEPNLPLGNLPPRHDLLVDLSTNFSSGEVRSTKIGPTNNWEELVFDWRAREALAGDSLTVDLRGIAPDETETALGNGLVEGSSPLNFVDAAANPFLRLEGQASDVGFFTAPQLEEWEVYYTPVGDALADPSGVLVAPDTIEEGQIVALSLQVRNPSDYDLDSLLVRYSLRRPDRTAAILGQQRYAELAAGGSMTIDYQFHSANKGLQEGDAVLIVELNPDLDQVEQYEFNNFYFHPVYIKLDHVGPILDVTVDGKHLMDGDIIAPEPEIVVQLNDDNAYLPVSISDTTYRIWFGSERTHTLNPQLTISGNSLVESVPGQLPDNKARLIYRPGRLADGEYTLAVQGFDFKGNQASQEVFKIHFNVVNEKSISDVLPYPNPFSSSTRFVYTLTGGERPLRFDIEIYTISGRLVKTVDLLAEGGVNFGYNVTDYAWDGRDEFGDLLANGVYVYKVNVKFADRFGVTKRDEGLPEGAMNGVFGKMYIMR